MGRDFFAALLLIPRPHTPRRLDDELVCMDMKTPRHSGQAFRVMRGNGPKKLANPFRKHKKQTLHATGRPRAPVAGPAATLGPKPGACFPSVPTSLPGISAHQIAAKQYFRNTPLDRQGPALSAMGEGISIAANNRHYPP
jgi:hypothetical protein